MIPVTSSHHQAEIRHLLTLQCKAFSWMGMGKGPNFLLLLPGMMLDLLLVRRSGFISVTISTSKNHIQGISNPRCVPEATAAPSQIVLCFRQGFEDPYQQYPAASHGDSYAHQSHQWQPLAWQDDRGMGFSFGSGNGSNLLLAEEVMFSPEQVVLLGLAHLQGLLLPMFPAHQCCGLCSTALSLCLGDVSRA